MIRPNRETDPLYNQIGSGYNLTRQADPYIAERLCALLAAEPGKRYVDIGCGTGNYTAALAAKGLDLWGIDPSEEMLATARRHMVGVRWLEGKAAQIPAADTIFDGGIATLTIHHWPGIYEAFREIVRVLKPGTPFIIFSATPEQVGGYWLNHYFPKMMADSIQALPSLSVIELAAAHAGLAIDRTEKYDVQPNLSDLFLYAGKDNPSIYFNETVRNGISSFAALANQAEVSAGLTRLREDLDSGRFDDLRKRYDHSSGDYLFIRLITEPHAG